MKNGANNCSNTTTSSNGTNVSCVQSSQDTKKKDAQNFSYEASPDLDTFIEEMRLAHLKV